MAKQAKKQHEKVRHELDILHKGQYYPKKDFELRKCYNERGKYLGMWWVSKTGEIRFRKIPNDEVIR